MLSEEENKFIKFWSENRLRQKGIFSQVSGGLWVGLLIGAAIILAYASGWYTRANMVANSQSTPVVLVLGVVIIAVFCSLFYKRHRWEINESYYQSLLKKKDSLESSVPMQQVDEKNSQVEKEIKTHK